MPRPYYRRQMRWCGDARMRNEADGAPCPYMGICEQEGGDKPRPYTEFVAGRQERSMRIVGLMVVLVWLAGCGAGSPLAPAATNASAARLVIAQTIDAQSLDPFLVNQVAGESIMQMMFDHLIERDFDGKLAPGLAESWSVVDDKTIEFKLRQGVTFHNGEAFDADAVKFSVERMLNPDLKSSFRGNFKAIKEVQVVNPSTVRLLLSQTDAAILDNLSAQLAIVPPKYL